jgi:hypothetical protein
MRTMRPVVILAILLVIMLLLAGCGQRVPPRNSSTKSPWNQTTPKASGGSGSKVTPTPTSTSPFVPVTITPAETATASQGSPYRGEPAPANVTANLTIIDTKKLIFIFNESAYSYTLKNPPLLIDYTLTVPNITKTRVVTDPVSGGDRTVTITYPDPAAYFEARVRDVETNRVIVRDGYGGQYDVKYSKKLWVRYPGTYVIEFSGNRCTAEVDFLVPKGT